MKASKKLLSLLLVVMLLVSAIPFQVFARTVHEDGSIDVPVVVKVGTNTYNKSITIPADTNVTLDENYAMDPTTGLVTNPSDKVFNAWYSSTATEPVTDKELSYAWLRGEAPENYSLTLVLNPKAPPAPTTYTATLKATLDGTVVGSDTKAGITEIDLTDELAKSLYSGFDPSKHEFKGWANNLSGKQELKADTTFTAVFETISAPTTYTATLKVTLDGTEVASSSESGVAGTKVQLTDNKAKGLFTNFNEARHEFKGWKKADGTSAAAEELVDGNPTFTAVFETITTYDVTVNVYRKNVFVTSQVVTGKTSVTLDNAFLKDVYADFDAATETAQWYRGAVGSTKIATGTVETLSANATYSVNIETTVPVSTHNITVYAVKYVGTVNRGVVSTPLFTAEINGTVNVLDYLERTDNWSVIESNAKKIGKIRTNPTFYTDRALTTKLKNETLTDAAKTVYVRVDVEEVKNVLLYVHKGSSIDKLTHLDPKVLHGYEAGDYVTYEAVQSVLGSKVKFYGLFTEERWDNRNANIKDDQLPKIRVTSNGVEIHVWVYSGSVSNADSTNPKTGDYILDTAVTLMVISGLAAAAVYVVGKKRRV
ncbi:MAG: hypothetical protein MR763_10545 [Clostridiales bacterium]|nr:hypothetical protein [Clostridiales bacterium]